MDWQDKHANTPDLPPAFRKCLIENELRMLRQMPEDPEQQRAQIMQRETQIPAHEVSSSPFRELLFKEEISPNLVSLPEEVACGAIVTHNIRTRKIHLNKIALLVGMSAKTVGHHDTLNDQDSFTNSLEKLWLNFAEHTEPPLTHKTKFEMEPGEFSMEAFENSGIHVRGLGFHPNDYQKVVAALEKMLVEVNQEIEAESKTDWFERLTKLPSEQKGRQI